MSDPAATSKGTVDATGAAPDAAPAEATRTTPWGRLGVIAAAAVLVAIIVITVVRILVSAPHPPLGPTAAADLQLGSCVSEGQARLEEYTVIDCAEPHPQQIVGMIDLSIATTSYTSFDAMDIYAQEVCDRFLEYGLYVKDAAASIENRKDYRLALVVMPTAEQYAADVTTALCALQRADSGNLVGDLYEPLPQ